MRPPLVLEQGFLRGVFLRPPLRRLVPPIGSQQGLTNRHRQPFRVLPSPATQIPRDVHMNILGIGRQGLRPPHLFARGLSHAWHLSPRTRDTKKAVMSHDFYGTIMEVKMQQCGCHKGRPLAGKLGATTINLGADEAVR